MGDCSLRFGGWAIPAPKIATVLSVAAETFGLIDRQKDGVQADGAWT